MGKSRILPISLQNKIDTILLQEGLPYNNHQSFNGSILATNQNNLCSMVGNFSSAHVILNAEGYVNSTENVTIYMSTNGDQTGVFPSILSNINVPKGSIVPIRFKTAVSPINGVLNMYGDSVNAGKPVSLGGGCSGVMMLNDLNFQAENKIYWMGDSITGFTSNAIGMNNFYQFQVRDWLSRNSSKGDYRLTQKAFGGKTSSNFNSLLLQGNLYIEKPDFIFYQLGVNDQSQSVSTTIYGENITRIINYKKTYWKDSILVLLGATPTQLTSRQTALEAYRNVMSSLVSSIGDPTIKFINLGNSFDRTATPSTIWASSDNPSSNVDCLHPGTLISHTAIADAIIAGIQGFGISF